MAGHGGFRHNAQGARIVDLLEERHEHGGGLNLTFDTRRSPLKGKVPDGFPLAADLLGCTTPPPLEARVVDLCDRIAYLCHDLDDGLRAGVITVADCEDCAVWRRGRELRQGASPAGTISAMIAFLIQDLIRATDARWSEAADARPQIRHGDDATVLANELLAFL